MQRFGSSLNLNVHLHVVVLDGVFVRDEGGSPIFRSAPPPSKYELDAVLARVHGRVFAWLGRHRYVNTSPSEALSDGTPSPTPLEACADLAMRRGTTTAVRDSGDEAAGKKIFARAAPAHDAVDREGFNLHASVHLEADDDLGRERLCRYGARPPFSLERFRALPGGRFGYRVTKARGGRAKVLVLTPLELLARLASLIPPPRYPLVRYHGVLAPRSSWRKAVVPRPLEREVTDAKENRQAHGEGAARPPHRDRSPHYRGADSSRRDHDAARLSRQRVPAPSSPDLPAVLLAPNVIAVRHWERLQGGVLLATAPRIPWSVLLRRTFDVDVLECMKCHGRLRVIGAIDDPLAAPLAARALLEQLGLPADAPAQARARDPSTLDGYDRDE